MKSSSALIILNYTKSGENSIVIHTLSREYGRRSFLVRVGRKASMATFLPLNIVEADITQNSRSALWHAGNFHVLYPLSGIRNNIYKNTMTLFMSEVLYRVVRDGAYEEGLFEWLAGSILSLDKAEGAFSNFHLLFLLEFAAAMGFSPSSADLAPFCEGNGPVISGLLSSNTDEASRMRLSGAKRNEIAEQIIRYLEYHTESNINVRSLKILRELFDNA